MSQLLTKGRVAIGLFTAAYIVLFGTWFLIQGNYEFLWYVATMLVFIALIVATLRTSELTDIILFLLSFWGLLHMLGGGVHIGDHVLYAQVLYPFHVDGDFTVLKYDQMVHAFGFGAAALALHHIMVRVAPGMKTFGRIMFPALASMGLSVINEIIEFAAVLLISDTWVGGYYNISLDLVFNTLGAFIAVIAVELFHSKT